MKLLIMQLFPTILYPQIFVLALFPQPLNLHFFPRQKAQDPFIKAKDKIM
jgi:hypothetical protein